jgi:hypothetical protein
MIETKIAILNNEEVKWVSTFFSSKSPWGLYYKTSLLVASSDKCASLLLAVVTKCFMELLWGLHYKTYYGRNLQIFVMS